MPQTADELWQIYLSKNPHWASGANLTEQGLKKLVIAAFEHGQKAQRLAETRDNDRAPRHDMPDFMSDLLRGSKSGFS